MHAPQMAEDQSLATNHEDLSSAQIRPCGEWQPLAYANAIGTNKSRLPGAKP